MATHSPSDPRTIVTPDAFEVESHLLGFPLAAPSRRLAAIAVDGVLIGVLTLLPAFLLGLVGAALFLRIWGKSEKGDPLARAFKWTMGCFGAFVLLVTLTVVGGVAVGFLGEDEPVRALVEEAVEEDSEGTPISVGLGDIVQGVALGRDYRRAESEEEARSVGLELARRMRNAGLGRRDIRDVLEDQAPPDPPWDQDAVVAGILTALEAGDLAADGQPDTREPSLEEADAPPGADPAELTLEEALGEYRALLLGDALDEAGRARAERLRRHLGATLGQDSLDALGARIEELDEELDDTRGDLERTRDRLEEAREGSGILAFLTDIVDELGLTFGWGSVYLTIFLTWWKGQTPGKRLLNIRVVRLDGEPIGWFVAFERAGGYAAGFATGLLGFAQVYWDSNRQAIHDKIVGTVVIRDGVDRVPGPWLLEEPGSTGPSGAASIRTPAGAAGGRRRRPDRPRARRSGPDEGGGRARPGPTPPAEEDPEDDG